MTTPASAAQTAAKWKRYPAYKESGIEWLGKVPAHWDTLALKRVLEIPVTDGPHETPEFLDEGVPFISAEAIKNNKINFSKKRGFISWEDHHKYSKKYCPQAGDIYLVKSGATTGNVAMVETDEVFNIWSPLAAIRPDSTHALTEFVFYFMQSAHFLQAIETGWSYGTQQNIGMGVIENIYITIPSLKEQQAIAGFLDRETARIDTLIAKKERLIELLQEKRTALISHAVTKGLNPDVPMKDSGIAPVGQIPEYWSIERNKNVFRERDKRSVTGEEELLTVSHITGVTPRAEKEVNMFMAESLEGYKLCYPDDLVINTMWAWMGALGFSDYEGLVSPSYNVYVLENNNYLPEYLDFLYRTPEYICEVKRYSKGVWTSRLRLYPDEFFNMHTITPPLAEQRAIVDHLKYELNRIERIIETVHQHNEVLREYRTTLISAAVTGKIDVRNGLQTTE